MKDVIVSSRWERGERQVNRNTFYYLVWDWVRRQGKKRVEGLFSSFGEKGNIEGLWGAASNVSKIKKHCMVLIVK